MAAYLYCITEQGVVPGPVTQAGLGTVYAVSHGGLTCVVSDLPEGGLSARTKDELVGRLLDHQRVIERAMARGPVLPVKFGTALACRNEVIQLLDQARDQFASLLAVIGDKIEIEVAATWDIDRALQEASREEDVVRAREAINRHGPSTLDDRLKLGRVVKACLDRRRRRYQDTMMAQLSPLALEAVSHPLVSDRMVMNVAFLLEKARQTELNDGVNRLDRTFGNEITFRVIGPLPPYSFSTVEIAKVTSGQMASAGRLLGLGDNPSENEVRHAFRRGAARLQQSLTPDGLLASAQLADMRQARERLLTYCQKLRPSSAAPFDAEEPVFVVTVKRSGDEEVDAARFGGAAPILKVDD